MSYFKSEEVLRDWCNLHSIDSVSQHNAAAAAAAA